METFSALLAFCAGHVSAQLEVGRDSFRERLYNNMINGFRTELVSKSWKSWSGIFVNTCYIAENKWVQLQSLSGIDPPPPNMFDLSCYYLHI